MREGSPRREEGPGCRSRRKGRCGKRRPWVWSVGAPSGDPAASPDGLEGPGHLQGLLGCSQGGLGPACGFSLHRGCLCSHPLSLVQNAFSVFHAFWHLFKALSMGWGGGGVLHSLGLEKGNLRPLEIWSRPTQGGGSCPSQRSLVSVLRPLVSATRVHPDGGEPTQGNPLSGTNGASTWEEGYGAGTRLHRVCCLQFL